LEEDTTGGDQKEKTLESKLLHLRLVSDAVALQRCWSLVSMSKSTATNELLSGGKEEIEE
jgi:hypothetical protein